MTYDMPDTIWAEWGQTYGEIQMGQWADTIRSCNGGTEYRLAAPLLSRIEALEAALKDIAAQKLIAEGGDDMGDVEYGYDACIKVARAALAKERPNMGVECAECQRDLRGGHDERCSRFLGLVCPICLRYMADGDGYLYCRLHGEVDPLELRLAELQDKRAALAKEPTDE